MYRYPIAHGRPVLIHEARSVFAHAAYAEKPAPRSRLDRLAWPSVNLSAVRVFERLAARLATPGGASVLVVGSGLAGRGMHVLGNVPALHLLTIDPSPGSDAAIHADAHDLPFADGSFDAVVVQAVLEHVADPVRCVAEIHRVLAPEGLVYSELPFMQQVHLQGYDFTRFSLLGHRRLFRSFRELESGAVAGPGTALAWAWRYFLAALVPKRASKHAQWIGRLTGLPLERLDHLVGQRAAGLDGASCTYFFGSRAMATASDRELVAGYRGAQ